RNIAHPNLAEPLPPLLLSRNVENAAPPRLTIKLPEALYRQTRLPKQVMQIVMAPVEDVDLLFAFLEVVSARQRGQDGESHAVELVLVDEIPQALKIFLGKIRIDDEISRHPKPEFAGNADGLDSPVDVGVLDQRVEAGAGGGFQAEENIEAFRQRTPELQQVRIFRDQIGAGLHQQQVLAFLRAEQGVSQFFAALPVSPEQIVDHEQVAASGLEVGTHLLGREATIGSLVELPYRTEVAPVGATTRRLHRPHRHVIQAGVALLVARDHGPVREGHLGQIQKASRLHSGGLKPALSFRKQQGRKGIERAAVGDGVAQSGQQSLSFADADCVHGPVEIDGLRVGRDCVATDSDKNLRVVGFDLVGQPERLWRFEDMQTRDGGQVRLALAQNFGDAAV